MFWNSKETSSQKSLLLFGMHRGCARMSNFLSLRNACISTGRHLGLSAAILDLPILHHIWISSFVLLYWTPQNQQWFIVWSKNRKNLRLLLKTTMLIIIYRITIIHAWQFNCLCVKTRSVIPVCYYIIKMNAECLLLNL